MSRGWYGITGTGNDMLNRYREQECISQYIRSKTKIKQQIDEIQNREPRHFCSRCSAIKEHIHAENNRINKCYLSNSKSLKLVDDDDIKRFIEECTEYPKCVRNRTHPVKKTVTSEKASVRKAKQQSGGDSKTSKHGGSPIKGPSEQDKNRSGGKVLTEEKPIPHKTGGINSSRNSGEAQEDASKQLANPPASTTGRIETQEQTISPSVHPPGSETDTHPSGSIEGTPNGENQLLKPTQVIDLGKTTSQSDSLSGQIAKDQIVKNRDSGDAASFTEISDTGDSAIKGVGTVACSRILDAKGTCAEKAIIRESSPVTSYGASTKLDITPDEYACSDEDFDELFRNEIIRNEAPDRETSSSLESGNPALGIAPHTAVFNGSTDADRDLTVSSHSHNIHVIEAVSNINMCQQTGDIVSIPRCVHSNSVTKFEKNPQKETRSEQENNQGQLSSRQESHQVHQLSQQKLAQKQGRLHSQQESSIQEEAHSGGNHYIIKDIIQHLHLQKNCSFNQIIYYPRSERSIYTNKFIYI
ncbi:VIR protein [Plasmodium vivax]|uniref:VIR protein n=1 Tax=Plasmodium vivax TaxID=5855 RepID=A0A1G4EC30_PLAVI|nr:VIR protein [Plasmodium vivax]